jgi:hypothetical protein
MSPAARGMHGQAQIFGFVELERELNSICCPSVSRTGQLESSGELPDSPMCYSTRAGTCSGGYMRKPPTDRHRAMAKRRSEGATLAAVASEFHTHGERVRQVIKRVEEYDRGAAMLSADPASIEALDLMGRLPAHVRNTLQANGIGRVTDIAGVSMVELMKCPNIGCKSATLLLRLLDEYRKSGAIAIRPGDGSD